MGVQILPSAWAMGRRPETKDWRTEGVIVTLHDCYDLALKQSETLAIQKQEIKRTNAEFLQAVGESVGDVNYKASNFRQEPQGGIAGATDGSTSIQTAAERRERKITINQPLFQGFKSVGALAGAGSLRKQRNEDVIRAKELLFLDVVTAFYTLLQAEKDLRTAGGIRDLYAERIEDLKEREKIGRSRASEIASAISRMKILEADLARVEGDVKIAKEQLSFLTGVPAELLHVKDEDLKPISVEDPDITEVVEGRSDVESSKQNMKTAWRKIIVAQSEFWPHVDLDVNQYEKRDGFQSGINWDMLFTIDVPIFKGGTTYGLFRESVVDWRQAKLNYELVKRQAALEIKSTLQSWLSSEKENKAMEHAVKASQENYRLQKEDYEKNLVNNLDVLEALQSFFETGKQASEAYYGMKQEYWKLRTALREVPEIQA